MRAERLGLVACSLHWDNPWDSCRVSKANVRCTDEDLVEGATNRMDDIFLEWEFVISHLLRDISKDIVNLFGHDFDLFSGQNLIEKFASRLLAVSHDVR